MRQVNTGRNIKSGQEVAKPKQKSGHAKYAKSHPKYWEFRLFHATYTKRDAKFALMDWSVRIQFKGRREAFNLKTPNRASAAVRARDIYLKLNAVGWSGTLAEYKPANEGKVDSPAVGEFLHAIQDHASIEPETFRIYAGKFRRIVAGIAGLEGDRSKYDYVNGGNRRWINKVESVKLAAITPESVGKWRKNFINRAGDDRQKRKTATHSANSFINNGKCLFAPKHLDTIKTIIELPERLPFEGVKLEGGKISRYISEIQPELLLIAARNELNIPVRNVIDNKALEAAKMALKATKRIAKGKKTQKVKEGYRRLYEITHAREIAESKNEQYKILMLALGVGLRRKEIDLLEWSAVLWDLQIIRIQATRYFQPKTEDSEADIDVDPDLLDILRGYYPRAKDEFVINGNRPRPGATYNNYRCSKHFNALTRWLRTKGITAKSPLHSLRKEFGSQINKEQGIFAASVALRHSNIRTTRDSYLDKKEQIIYRIGHILKRPAIKAVSE